MAEKNMPMTPQLISLRRPARSIRYTATAATHGAPTTTTPAAGAVTHVNTVHKKNWGHSLGCKPHSHTCGDDVDGAN